MYNSKGQVTGQGDPYCDIGGMFLEGLTVCVGYSDFLDVTLTENLDAYDEFVVVTSPTDKATHAVCTSHGVTCVKTDVFYEHGDSFNKGAGISLGLAYLRHRGWIIHQDADIVLPDRLRFMLNKSRLDADCIYGADRLNVTSYEKWLEVKNMPEYQRQYHHRFMVTPPQLPIGSRLIHNELGYCPLGYFQLWNSKHHNRRYHFAQGSAEHTDLLFSAQWPAAKRILLPGFFVYHLESEPATMGQNWAGRITKPFKKQE